MAIGSIIQLAKFDFKPSAPPAGSVIFYIKTDNVVYVQDSSGSEYPFASADMITALHGDVTAAGPGDAAAVVVQVGGKTASEIAQSVDDTQAATSANTPSVILKRDSSGNVFVTHINGVVPESHASRHLPTGADPITTAAPISNLTATTANDVGTANSLARSDHSHAIDTGTPVTQTPDQSNASGSSPDLSRADHIHDIPTDVPVDTGAANAQGSANKFAKSDHVHNVPVTNGLQNLLGTLSPIYGSGVNTVTQGNDPRLSTTNLVKVKQNPGAGEFSSVAAALTSITTNSISNPFVIDVGPGIFSEPQLIMKPYVYIRGSDAGTTLTATTTTGAFVVACNNSGLSEIGIAGATGSGGQGLYFKNNNPLIVAGFSLTNVSFGSSETLIYLDGTGAGVVSISVNGVTNDATAVYTTGIEIVGTNSPFPYAAITGNNISLSAFSSSVPTDFIKASGLSAVTQINNILLIGNPSFFTGTGIHLSNGASFTLITMAAAFLGRGIYIENTGAAPNLNLNGYSSTVTAPNIIDVQVDHPTATGTITGSFKSSITSVASPNLNIFNSDPTDGITFTGDLNFGPTFNDKENVTDLLLKGPTMGLYDGGELSDGGGFVVNITAGDGYLAKVSGVDKIVWSSTSITLTASTSNYIYFNSSGLLTSSSSLPPTSTNILLGRVVTNASGIEFIDDSPLDAQNYGNSNDGFNRDALGSIFKTGCLVTQNATQFHLNVGSGVYYFGNNKFSPSSGTDILFDVFYQNGSGGWNISSTHVVNHANYDDGSGTLASLTAAYFARHALYIIGQGANQKYLLIIAQTEYATLVQAENGVLPLPPSYFDDGVVLIASIIVQQGASSIGEIRDERPVIGFKASGTNAAITHGNLLGLSADDHTQYLLVNGSRAMSGNLDMGGNNIINLGTVAGVNIPTHESRHLPNGADPLTTAAPLTNLDSTTSNATGVANSLSRSDHSHAITTAAPVTQIPDQSNTAGSSAGLAKADHVHNIPSGTPVQIGTSNIGGSSTSFSLSDHIHAHGNQTSPTLHALVTGSAHGFMSSTDKTKLDASTALNTPSTLVLRDASGNFSAGAITASLVGNASTATTAGTATNFSGSLSGDVTGTQSATVVALVGTSSAANVHSAELLANAATNLNTASTIVKRDASGNFSAGAISIGSAIYRDSGSNTVTVQAPTTISSSYSLKLPTSQGSAGTYPVNDGSGNLSWTNPLVNIDGGAPNSNYIAAQLISGGSP